MEQIGKPTPIIVDESIFEKKGGLFSVSMLISLLLCVLGNARNRTVVFSLTPKKGKKV